MTKGRKPSGIRKKYLRDTIALLILALMLSSIGGWIYVREKMSATIIDQYEFMTEREGLALDALYRNSDEATAECILYEDVQKTLQTRGLEEISYNALSKSFAYVDLEGIADYCYVDNKKNVYSRSYSSISYEQVEESGFREYLGDEYSRTIWFWTSDRLFGTGEEALFIGRYVRSLEYAHEPGMLFFKMDPRFLEEIIDTERENGKETAIGIMDADGQICTAEQSEEFPVGASEEAYLIEQLKQQQGTGMILEGEHVKGGVLSAYRQAETGFVVFSFVPDEVLNQGLAEIILVFAGIYLVVIIVAVVLSMYFAERFTKPIQTINEAMTGFDGNDFEWTIELHTNTELDEIGLSYNKMLANIQRLLEEIKDQEKELRTSELNMLISQINPHFLYNTLDTIYMLARINKEETTMKMIQALSTYLRLSLSKGSEIVTVEDELENVKSYMEIQQIRNENLFSYEVDCQVDAAHTWVLKLILQPLVENAIKYGFCNIFEGGQIRIQVRKEGEILCLEVYNSGTPIEKEIMEKINAMNEMPLSQLKECFPDKKRGYGVVNIMTRLRLKYGDAVRFCYEAEQDGTRCLIKIPGGGKTEE